MTIEELTNVYDKEINNDQFNKSYYRELYKILVRQRVDAVLDSLLLEQINGVLFMPNAQTAFAWITRFSEYVQVYKSNPESINTDQHYIPMELKNYFFSKGGNVSNLEYLVQDNGICAILPFIEDIIETLDSVHIEIEGIEDEITRYYYYEQIRPFVRDIHMFMTRTIDWTNTYDRTR